MRAAIGLSLILLATGCTHWGKNWENRVPAPSGHVATQLEAAVSLVVDSPVVILCDDPWPWNQAYDGYAAYGSGTVHVRLWVCRAASDEPDSDRGVRALRLILHECGHAVEGIVDEAAAWRYADEHIESLREEA